MTNAFPVLVRIYPDQLAELDDWISSHYTGNVLKKRPEAIRFLLAQALAGQRKKG